MDRRRALKIFSAPLLLVTPILSVVSKAFAAEVTSVNSDSYVLIFDSKTSRAESFVRLLVSRMPSYHAGWLRNLRILDVQTNRDAVQEFMRRFGPNTTETQYPILVSTQQATPEHPEVEIWTMQWLSHVERLQQDACYPVSGGWWSVEGDWYPSVQKVRKHLFKSVNHKDGKFEEWYLDLLNLEESQSLHSDHHREMTDTGRVVWDQVNVECPA